MRVPGGWIYKHYTCKDDIENNTEYYELVCTTFVRNYDTSSIKS